MRISDWSSDVCSSDLLAVALFPAGPRGRFDADAGDDAAQHDGVDAAAAQLQVQLGAVEGIPLPLGDQNVGGLVVKLRRNVPPVKIGRASWRESVCQYG